MNTVPLAIENITKNTGYRVDGMLIPVYSVIDSMKCYRIYVSEEVIYQAEDQEGNPVADQELATTLINQVIEYRKGEK